MASNNTEPGSMPELNVDRLDEILKNVYDACDTAPNSVPIESLISYSRYRKERHIFAKALTIAALVIFILLPFLFIAPELDVQQKGPPGAPEYIITVDSFIPVSVVTASMDDGTSLVVYESGLHEYTVLPSENGTINIKVILFNRQYQTAEVSVDGLDKKAPSVKSQKTNDGLVYIYVSDEGTGVDYTEIYALTVSGETVMPEKYSTSKGFVAFRYPEETLNVYIPDKAGNILSLLVSI